MSVGVLTPGITGMPSSRQRSTTAGLNPGATTKVGAGLDGAVQRRQVQHGAGAHQEVREAVPQGPDRVGRGVACGR